MIKANDLRLGNYILFNGVSAQKINHTDLGLIEQGFDCYAPIPLTPDIMVKAGYEDFRLDTIVPFEFADATHCAWFDKDVLVLCPFCTNDKDLYIQLQFVHKLQNLHYALTGTELSITL